ncbi:MAG: plasmid mobilization protein [Bacteroidales bacterium]
MQIKRSRKIECRVSNMEKLALQKKAQQAGVTLSDYIRSTALDYDLAYKLTSEEVECYKELTRLKNNFQNIANYMKYKANLELRQAITDVIALVNQQLKKFY